MCVNIDLKLTNWQNGFVRMINVRFVKQCVNKLLVINYKLLFEPSYQESVPFLILLVVLPIRTTTSAVSNSPSAVSN